MNISELRVGMKNVSVKGRVVEKSETSEVYSRYGYNVHRVVNAKLSDDTGSIKLVLWNEQIDIVNVGDTLQIENGHITQFRGETQLNVGKRYGRLNVIKK